jgi:ketosteroid isomerase-like protein
MRIHLNLAAAVVALSVGGTVWAAPAPAAAPVAKPATPAAAPAKPAGPSDKAQIDALEKGFIAAFRAKNVDKIMACYAKDGLFVFDVVPPRDYDTWAAYKKDFEALLATSPGPIDVAMSALAVTVVGPVAYSHSMQDGHFTAADGSKSEMMVRVTDVYRKAGGHWKIVQGARLGAGRPRHGQAGHAVEALARL